MKKFRNLIYKLRGRSYEERRHIMILLIMFFAVFFFILWTFTIRQSFSKRIISDKKNEPIFDLTDNIKLNLQEVLTSE